VSAEPGSPAGEQRLDRAAAAQRTAIAHNADVGVWIDDDEVWAVLADGRDVRHAPLPDGATPRVFAAIATSLVDELLAPPVVPGTIGVDVHVDITPSAPPPQVAIAPPPPPPAAAPVIFAPPSVVTAATPDVPRTSRTLLEIGGTVSNATIGGQVEVLWPLTPTLRFGALAGMSSLFDGFSFSNSGAGMIDAGIELRHVGTDTGKTHFDVGPELAIARSSAGDTGGIAAVRLALTRELSTLAITAAIAPMYLFGFGYEGSSFSVLGSLSVSVPL
jgi:hypothetical protein